MVDVGIVMPVYKQKPEYLIAAVQSIMHQTHRKYHFVIVIDGDPAMLEIVQSIAAKDPRIEIIVNETNLGVARALNRGFEALFQHAHLQYVTWVSSDNLYYPQFIEVLRRALGKGPQTLGLVYSSFHSINDEGNRLYDEQQLALQREYQSQPKEFLLDACITGVSFMYKSHFAKKIAGYHLQPVEDYEYWLRLTELCDMKFIPVELVAYRVNSEYSISSTLQSVENHRTWRYAFHLARHQARQRRNIPPAVTIIFCVHDNHPQMMELLEKLYEQSYSNYELMVLDLSSDRQPTSQIAQISHPTVCFKWFPNLDEVTAIFYTLQFLKTPFTLVLGKELFQDVLHLNTLVTEMEKAEFYLISNYMTGYHLVGYRSHIYEEKPYYNELFRTDPFFKLLLQKHYSGRV